jgi:hypothetical protein
VAHDSLGGYRLIRKLGEGTRAEVFLAHPVRDDSPHAPVAIKVLRADVDPASALAEATALSRAAGDHVVALHDVAHGPSGALALVLDRAAGGSVARVLRDRGRLRVGEAITVLAPVASTVARLHDVGVVHGAIRAEAVLFDSAGAPVLACFGRSVLIEPALAPARREADAGIVADLRGLAQLCSALLRPHPQAAALLAWLEEQESRGSVDWPPVFAERLFDLAVAEPVDLRVAESVSSAPVPARVVTGEPIEQPAPSPTPLPNWLEGFVPASLLDSVAPVVRRGRAALATVRRPVWVVAGAVAVALVVALVVIPEGGPDATPQQSASPTTPAPPAVRAGPVGGDDPVEALPVLLEARDRCIRELSILCLDSVDQPGSAALEADQRLIREVQGGAEIVEPLRVDVAAVTLVERLGDSALLAIDGVADSEPASVLLMKGEAGWRIRDYLEE